MPKPSSGIKRGGGGAGAQPNVDTVRGVPQSKIDQLRGERDHQKMFTITAQTIKDDYARVGINITNEEAEFIHQAVMDFSYGSDTAMRKAKSNEQQGRMLREDAKQLLKQYDAIAEYCKVAPVLPSSQYDTIYRGIKLSTITPEYSAKLLAKKVGDTWDVDRMPTSFSTTLTTAQDFSYHDKKKGIVMHMPTKGLKNSPSIKGMSQCPYEDEVMVSDYSWKITKIDDQRNLGGYYNIYLEHA